MNAIQAEIISIGTEITSGAKLDTNSQWLSLQLAEIGITTVYHTTVADDLDANVSVFRNAIERADLVLITGGLGPTLDDLTREALAAAVGIGLELDTASLETIERFFRSRGREMPARNRIQAMFPAGSRPLANPVGTAPGIWMEIARKKGEPCRVAAMPGVPSEMKKMYFERVLPKLHAGQKMIRRARLNCFGLGESHTEELLGNLTARGHDPEIGITAHDATITLRIVAQGSDADECQKKIDWAAGQIRNRLGDYVFGEEDEELQHIIVRELNQRRQTFASIESGTCGLLAENIAHVSGAAISYRGGTVLPAITTPLQELGEQLRRQTGADFILCVGNETIGPDADEQMVSTIPIGILFPQGRAELIDLKWGGNPAFTRQRAMKTILNMLRLDLKSDQPSS